MRLKLLAIVVLIGQIQAETFQFREYISVDSSNPEYEILHQRVPYQECYYERLLVHGHHRNSSNIAGSILGGAIGGVVGHQIGEGKGNDIATVGGAILGTIVGGNSIESNQHYREPRYKIRHNCVTKYHKKRAKRHFIGYKNIGYYKGKKIIKYANRRLTSIPVTVTIDF